MTVTNKGPNKYQSLQKSLDELSRRNEMNVKFINAVWHGDTAKIRECLDAGVDINICDSRDAHGETALMSAADRGNTSIIELLLEHGADINARNQYGSTALIKAASHGHIDVMKILIQAGADANIEDNEGLSAFAILRNNYPHIFDKWMSAIQEENLKKEDLAQNRGYTPDFDI